MADVLPRTTKSDPWDLAAAMQEQLARQALQEQKFAQNVEAMPLSQKMAIERLRAAKELGLEFLPQELAAEEPFRQRAREHAGRIAREGRTHATDEAVRGHGGKLDVEAKILEKYPDFYAGRRRIPPTKVPSVPPGWEAVVPAPEISKFSGTRPTDTTGRLEYGDPIPGPDGRTVFYPYRVKRAEEPPKLPAPGGVQPGSERATERPVGGKGDRAPLAPARPTASPTLPPVEPSDAPDMSFREPSGALTTTEGALPIQRQNYLGNPDDATIVDALYDSVRQQGASDIGAKVFLAEIGRENSFNPDLIFGSHKDPYNKATNVGMLSWQGDRAPRVLAKLKAEGLLDERGKIRPSKDALDVMAEYAWEEMPNEIKQYLASDKVNPEEAARILGREFIRWRYDDPRYRRGHINRRDALDAASKRIDSRQKPKPQVQATADPDIFDVILDDSYMKA